MEKECIDCSVTYSNLDREIVSCRICGAVLQISRQQREREQFSSHSNDESFEDLMTSLASTMQSRNNAPLSVSFLKTIGKINLDERLTLLHETTLRVGLTDSSQLRVNVIPAAFSYIPIGQTISGRLVWGDPLFGEGSLREESNNDPTYQWSGKIVIFLRGKVSFAKKYDVAVSAKAAGVIVVQTFDIWPFVMADTTNELGMLMSSHSAPSTTIFNDTLGNIKYRHELFILYWLCCYIVMDAVVGIVMDAVAGIVMDDVAGVVMDVVAGIVM